MQDQKQHDGWQSNYTKNRSESDLRDCDIWPLNLIKCTWKTSTANDTMISNKELKKKIKEWGLIPTIEAIEVNHIEDPIIRELALKFKIAFEELDSALFETTE